VLAVALVACGSDDDDSKDTSPPPTSAALAGGAAINVTAADYSFAGLPATAKAGSKFAMTNGSTKEFHEMVMLRIPDDEKRSVAELAALPEAEADAIFAAVEPALVTVAKPGEAGTPVVGDGVVAEPGRYAVVCFIPVGADPDEVAKAMNEPNPTGPPNLGDGPPHASKGMVAEITIEP
jgi:uncharacterized cupredoxin-like copper-binding protein